MCPQDRKVAVAVSLERDRPLGDEVAAAGRDLAGVEQDLGEAGVEGGGRKSDCARCSSSGAQEGGDVDDEHPIEALVEEWAEVPSVAREQQPGSGRGGG